jgi:hypothetical protein
MKFLDNPDFIEKLIVKAMMSDKRFVVCVHKVIEERFFEFRESALLFSSVVSYFTEFKDLPGREVVLAYHKDAKDDIKAFIDDLDSLDFDLSQNYDFLMKNTDAWVRNKALRHAIMDGVEIIQKGRDDQYGKIRELVNQALSKTLMFDMGLDYFNTLGDRLQRIFTHTEMRIPTFFPQFDEYINGGFPPLTLSIGAARVHGNKCVSYDTLIDIKNPDGSIEKVKIGDFVLKCAKLPSFNKYQKGDEFDPQSAFIKKYGKEEGIEKWEKWKKL